MSLLSQVTVSLTRQQRAAVVVFGITALLVFVAFDISLILLVAHGWHAFIDRGAGVGATPSNSH